MAGRVFRAQAVMPSTNVLDYGADPTGLTDSRAAIQSAIDATAPGSTCYMPPGRYLVEATSTTSLAEVLRLRPKVRLVGAGVGQTYLLRGSCGSAAIVAIRAAYSGVSDMTILNHGYRTGFTYGSAPWFAGNTPVQYNYGTYGYQGWEDYYAALLATTGFYVVPGAHDCGVFIACNGVTVERVSFDSEWTDERGWLWTALSIGVNEDQTNCNNITIQDCQFYKARFGLLAAQADNLTFQRNTHYSTWSYANAAPGHMIYMTGTPANYTAAEFHLSKNMVVSNNVDIREWLATTYALPTDYFGDVSIKLRKVDGLTMENNVCISEQAGFNLYDIKNGSMAGDYYDASTCPESGTQTWGAGGSFPLFAVANTQTPSTGYTVDDFILGPMNLTGVTITTPYQPVGDSGWVTWVTLTAYTNGTPKKAASVADQWRDVSIYIAPKPSAASNDYGMGLIGKNGSYGSVSQPIRFFPHPTLGSWGSDQQFFLTRSTIGTQNTTNAMRFEVYAPNGTFVSGHPPYAHAGQSGSSNTLNGSAFEFPTDVQFSNTTTSDPN